MKVATFLFSVLSVVVAVKAVIEEDEGVLVLDDDNFEQGISDNQLLLIEFYAPWCGHCKSLAPEWVKAASLLDSKSSPAKLAKVDATIATKTAAKFEIRGFPTIKFFRNGSLVDYQGGRTAPEIVTWLDKKTGPATTTLTTLDDLDKFQEANDVFVLGVFFSTDSASAKTFASIASADDSLAYATTTSAEIQKKLAVKGDAIVILKDYDDKRADLPLTGDLDATALKAFISENSMPLIHEFSAENSKKIFGTDIKHHVLFFTDKKADYHASTIAAFTEVSKAFKGKFLFVNVPHTESRVVDFFGIGADSLPAMVLADMSGESQMKKFFYSGEFKSAEITTFVNSFLAGKLTPTLKSEELAPTDTTGDVVILKGKSFMDLVINNDKDVLVEFYAPWCGHCKKLEPLYNELGQKMKSVKSVVIAKMDSTANEIDVPGVAVQGYPTILFFKGNNKANPVKYEAGREVEDFITYLEENAATPFDL